MSQLMTDGHHWRLPDGVLGMAGRGPEWATWVEALPALTRELLQRWDLRVSDWLMHGNCSVVVPVLEAGGSLAVLKIAFPDDESEHEHVALTRWAGDGAVRLLRADPGARAMLLERLHPRETLCSVPVEEACEVVAGLYARLHVPASPRLRPLTAYVERWSEALQRLPPDAPIPRRLVEQATALSRDLVSDPRSVGTVIHADLHYDNVLAADREPWLAIDPKPVSGDPDYEPAPMLWNRWAEVVGSGSVRSAVRRRFHALVDAGGLDEARARDWVVVRMVHHAHWTVDEARQAARSLGPEEQDRITTALAIAKAVQD
jgi:streptomycin 6-kinase